MANTQSQSDQQAQPDQGQSLSNTAEGLMRDIERALDQRLGRLKDQLADELGKAATAGAAFGGGLGMTALGTVLGGIGFVHLLHRATGLPLWFCYAASSATACAVGAGLVTQGVRKVGEMELIPEGADRAARQVAERTAEHATR